MRVRTRIGVLAVLAVASLALVAASTAWACTEFQGFTYWDGGSRAEERRGAGTTISGIYGAGLDDPGYFDTSGWRLVASQTSCCGGPSVNMHAGPLTLSPSSSPAQIGPVTGTVPTTKGDYLVCFLNQNNQATNSVSLEAI